MTLTKPAKGDIVTAWSERCSGPGWSNHLLHVLYRAKDGDLSIKYLQPEEWQKSPELVALAIVAEHATNHLLKAISK